MRQYEKVSEEDVEKTARQLSSASNIESVEITPSSNGGFSVRKRCRSKPTKGNEAVAYQEPETYVFANVAALTEWLNEAL